MSEGPSGNYLVRDPQGNVYGPANAEMLRDWVKQGRIVAGMAIAAQETREWVDAAGHPAVADLLGTGAGPPALQYAPVAGQAPGGLQAPAATQGWPVTAVISYAGPPRQNLLGVLALVFGAGSMVVACAGACLWFVTIPISGLLAVAAVTLGCLAISQIRGNSAAYTGPGMAVAGIALGGTMILVFLTAAAAIIIRIVAH